MNVDSHEKDERVDDLVDALCEEGGDAAMTKKVIGELDRLLRDDRHAQRRYLFMMDLHANLRWRHAGQATFEALARRKAAGLGMPAPPVREASRRFAIPRFVIPLAAAAAVVVLAAAAVLGTGGLGAGRADRRIAEVVEATGARWDGPRAPVAGTTLAAGPLRLRAGLARLSFAHGAEIALEGRTLLDLVGAQAASLRAGKLVLLVPPGASGFAIRAPGLEIKSRDGELGVDVDDRGAALVNVFRGEVAVTVSAAVTGKEETLRLTRNDGLRVEPGGGLTTQILGDADRFSRLLDATAAARPLLANASFEHPSTRGGAQRAAAGWTLNVYPAANANDMMVGSGAGVLEGRRAHLGFVGATPGAPVGRQWGYLNAETMADGRKYHTSMHQEVGPITAGRLYRLSGTVLAQGQGATSSATNGVQEDEPYYTWGLYLGTSVDGPTAPLKVVKGPARPHKEGPARVSLEYRAPEGGLFGDQVLFVRIESVPAASRGLRHVFVDDLRLEVTR